MSADQEQGMSRDDMVLQRRLRLIGTYILVAGLTAAGLVRWTAAPDDFALDSDTKRYEYQMEYIGGRSNLLATEIREWFTDLWHGKRLAHTLAFLSVGGSFACFFLAHRLNHAPRAGRRGDGKAV